MIPLANVRRAFAFLAVGGLATLGPPGADGPLGTLGGAPLHAQEPDLSTKVVDVDGLPTRYHAAGLERRERGEPVVVFQSGGGGDLTDWTQVLAGLPNSAAILAYDRPGLGGTSAPEGPLSLELVSDHLRGLLEVLEIPPPYILVGHSWGGPLILDYAERHPEEVAGSIYVDPFQFLRPTREEERELVMRAAGASDAEADSLWREMEAWEEAASGMPEGLPPGVAAEFRLITDYGEAAPGARIPPPSHPVNVLLAMKPVAPPPFPDWLDPMEWFRVERAYTRGRFEEWLRDNPDAVVLGLPESGHSVPAEAPHAIVEAIDAMRRVIGGEAPGGLL
jgi:pimeloyl-ACP methyl ester carboxylesterase